MSTLEKKKRKTTVLPNDLLLSCLARVSRLYYPILCLVSKSFRSLLTSPGLYKTRSLLGRSSESCLYVCLQFPPDSKLHWFALTRKPNDKPKSSGYILATVEILHSPLTNLSSLVAVGSNIYNIGGPINGKPSSSILILDCQSHTWRKGPSMQKKRMSPSVSILDGKIYVTGGRKSYKSSKLIDVFDPKTQTWEHMLSIGIDEKISMFHGLNGFSGVPYNPKYDSRDDFEQFCYCVIDNVVYCYHQDKVFKWLDTKARLWRNLKGLEGKLKIPKYSSVKVADYGGRMAVLWDYFLPSSGIKMLCCAMITLLWHNDQEVTGYVKWFNGVRIATRLPLSLVFTSTKTLLELPSLP